MKKKCFAVVMLTMVFLMSSGNVFAGYDTMISVGNTTVSVNEEIVVPIKINNNTGICGATLSVSYDSELSLIGISAGEAFSSLIMTKPGDLCANPFNLVFDGIEEDASDGVIAYLCFESVSRSGMYDVSIAYDDGDIVNGNLEAVSVITMDGQVKVSATSDDEVKEEDKEDVDTNIGTVITIGNAVTNPGESVDVPVYISGNTGVCGVTMQIIYDKSLTLTQITKGEALPDLIMTKPGDLCANPFNLVFDGIEEDTSNGLFFILTFTAPHSNGIYDITGTYEDGDVVDGELNPIDVLIKKGSIIVGKDDVGVIVNNKPLVLPSIKGADGTVFVASYNDLGYMTSVKSYDTNTNQITVNVDANTSYAKGFCWTENIKPLCEAQKIKLN